MIIIILSSLITTILLMWMNSDVIVEWGGIFGLSKLLKLDEFNHSRLESAIKGCPYNYPTFLKEKYNYNFITKLLGCPLCLGLWLTVLISIPISIIFIPVIYVISMLMYGAIKFFLKL